MVYNTKYFINYINYIFDIVTIFMMILYNNLLMETKEEIKRNIPISYYYQLQMIIKNKIANGELTKGSLIPSEKELCNQYKLSRVTVRKAISGLASEKILEKKQGKVTIVKIDNRQEVLLGQSFSFYGYLKSMGFNVLTNVVSFKKKYANKNIRILLQLGDNEKIFEIVRIRLVNGEPWYYVKSFFPFKFYPNLKRTDLENNSFYEFMINIIGINLFGLKRKLYPKTADNYDEKLLNVEKGSILQVFENLDYTEGNIPIEYSVNVVRADKIMFEVELTKERLIDIGNKVKNGN